MEYYSMNRVLKTKNPDITARVPVFNINLVS